MNTANISINNDKFYLDKFDEDTFINAYCEFSREPKLSLFAKQFLADLYPVNKFFPLKNRKNEWLGGCFIVGYNIRKTEIRFSRYFKKHSKNINHNKDIKEILDFQVSDYEKVRKIAEYKEQNNDCIGIGKEVECYSIIGFDNSIKYFSAIVDDYFQNNWEKARKFGHKELIKEVSFRNAALGYCFRVAEEIVL